MAATLKGKVYVLGTGILTWQREERITGRYGTVWLMSDGDTSLNDSLTVQKITMPRRKGLIVELYAEVLSPRKSTHIGDHTLCIKPTTPKQGEHILLGKGLLRSEGNPNAEDGTFCVGVFSKEKDDLSLDPKALYRSHEQLVCLYCVVLTQSYRTESQFAKRATQKTKLEFEPSSFQVFITDETHPDAPHGKVIQLKSVTFS